MQEQYCVIFERCGSASAGEIVSGAQVATNENSLDYLLRIGAIEAVAALPPAPQKPKASDNPKPGDKPRASEKD